MFKSLTGVGLEADALIRSYHSFMSGTVADATDTANGPRALGELRAVAGKARAYADDAERLMAKPDFASLDPLVQEDILAISEEAQTGLADLDEETNPDKKWKKLDPQAKLDATQRLRADDSAVARFRDRLQGRMRGQARELNVPPPQR